MRQLTREDWMKILLVAIIAILVLSYFWDAIVSLLFPRKPMVTFYVEFYDEEGNIIWEGEMATVGVPLAVVKINEKELVDRMAYTPKIYIEYTTNYPDETEVLVTVTRWEVTVEDEYGVVHTLVPYNKCTYPKKPSEATKVGDKFTHQFLCKDLKGIIDKADILRWVPVNALRHTVAKVTAIAILKIRGTEVDRKSGTATLGLDIKVEPDPIKGSITKMDVYVVSMSYLAPLSPP